ncbi:hypothetical protein [Paenibacillus sp. VTT E-133291]|uniref:hypothetical protein n=1 Tax=Paenibacillus sp. VTT E-133291 TaxID=1986223 RepID=UPI000BA07528|nr:hypothetical protein [Paenibacillus sp. VTT E-133291]OZQ74724.1 hypothetical protein CA598_31430 [Paenibacillus sp. VTT E-133291]
MALLKELETASGITLQDAYIKIENTSGNAETQSIIVCIYVNEDSRMSGKSAVDEKYYTFPCSVSDEAPNFIKQGYQYLKTLPEYSEAIDSL